MKILQIHNLYQKHGGEDVVVEVERKLLEENGHIVLSLIADNRNIKNLYFERKNFYKKLDGIISDNPDIDFAHVHNIFSIIGPGIYKYLKKYKISIVQTVHNFRFLCPNGLFFDSQGEICELCKGGNFRHSVLKKCYHDSFLLSFLMQYQVNIARNFAIKMVDKFIALSNFTKNKLIEGGFDKNKIIVKPNFLYPQPPHLSLANDRYAVFIGRISKEKGLDVLIKAFININFRLIIAGTGDILENLKEKCKKYNNIEFLGFVSGLEKEMLLDNASFIVVPSLQYENFPVSILDAFSRGKAVVASRIGSIPEIVIDGYSGVLFEMGNPESLKESVSKLIVNNNFETIGKNSYNEFISKYQTNQNYIHLITIYNSINEREN